MKLHLKQTSDNCFETCVSCLTGIPQFIGFITPSFK